VVGRECDAGSAAVAPFRIRRACRPAPADCLVRQAAGEHRHSPRRIDDAALVVEDEVVAVAAADAAARRVRRHVLRRADRAVVLHDPVDRARIQRSRRDQPNSSASAVTMPLA